jgi:Tol biopolymer transport system component
MTRPEGAMRFRRFAGWAAGGASVIWLGAMLLTAGARPASASCNLIPQTAKTFDSVLGSTNRPFAAPGEPIELRVRPCDTNSAGFSATLTDQVVTVVFTPSGGPQNAAVLTAAADCSALTAQLSACEAELGGGTATCVAGPAAGLQLLQREDGAHLQFLFPNTDALVGAPTDVRTLAGPAAIGVSPATAPLPCGITLTNGCAAQSGLIACVDDFFSNDGSCTSTRPQGTLNHFTALPVPNDFGIDCTGQIPPCANVPGEFRLTTDKDGNLLLPMNWQKVLVRQAGTPFPRLLRALLSAPAPVSVGPSFTASLTPEGGPLAPIFVPQVDPTTPRTVLNLFGSADAPYTILRVARRSASFQQCLAGAYPTLPAVPCNSDDDCPPVCDGGSTNPGQFCTSNGDCTGGGSCGGAGTCGVTVCFGGSSNGSPCTSDANCPGGECGPSAFNAGLLDLLAFGGVGPILIPQAVNMCAAGTNATLPCTSSSDCPGGICVQNGICQQTGATCGPSSACSTGTGPCVQYALTADNPIPLQSLAAQTDQVFGFTADESIDGADRNGDSDPFDSVVTMRDRTTGVEQFLGAPANCGISGTPEGRAVTQIQQPPFVFPAVATEGDAVAFLESEVGENSCDENGNGAVFDSILRVFRLGQTEVTAGLSPVRVLDAAPVINDQSLVISNGVVFYRRSEAAAASKTTSRVNVDPTGTQVTDFGVTSFALSADGRYVAFGSGSAQLVPPATPTPGPPGTPTSTGTPPPTPPFVRTDMFVHDRCVAKGGPVPGCTPTTERVSVDSFGTQGNGPSDPAAPAISADGRYVAFASAASNLVLGDLNGRVDVFVRDLIAQKTTRVSINNAGVEGDDDSAPGGVPYGSNVAISADGRYVVFPSKATNLDSVVPDTNGFVDVFLRDRCESNGNPVCATPSTTRMSLAADGVTQGDQDSGGLSVPGLGFLGVSISADGRFVAFASSATNLLGAGVDTNLKPDVFVRDRCLADGTPVAGCSPSLQRVSVASDGTQGNGGGTGFAVAPSLSPDGRYVSFVSDFTTLVPGSSGSFFQTFVHDQVTGLTTRESVAIDGTEANANSGGISAISAGGRYIVFCSAASNLVAGDTNGTTDIFLRDRITGTMARLNLTPSGAQSSGEALGACTGAISDDGSSVAFGAAASDLVTGDTNFLRDQFVRGIDVTDTGSDITGDGDLDDTVLEQLDTRTATVTTLCPADQVAAAGGVAAFLRPEAAGAMVGCPAVPSGTDEIVHVANGGSVQSLALAASAVSISAQCSGGSNMGQVCDADADCPGASCAASWIAALATDAVPGRTELEVHPAASGSWTDVGQAADAAQVNGGLVAFITPEALQGTDLNGDHDKKDRVIQVYDADAPLLTNLGQAAEEFVAGTQKPACAQSPVIAFRTSEAAQGNKDLNGDGDRTDFVLQFWAKGLNGDLVINTGHAVTPCNLQACDPRQPYQVNRSQIKFLTRESDQGKDLNGNGNLNDLVLQIFDVCSGQVTVVGAVDETVTNANPLAAGGTPQTGASVVVTGGNRCFSTAATCTSDADCTAPAACVAGGICGTASAVPASCATSADCPAGTSCLPDQVVAAPAVPPAQHDSVLLAPAPLTITILKCRAPATTCSATKLLRVGLRNADIGPPVERPGHTVQVVASDGTCPPGTVSGRANINRTGSDSILLAGGRMAAATIPITVSSNAFSTFSRLAPTRCTLQVAATTVLNTGQDNRDPSPANNTVGVELNVIDLNDPAQSTPHESSIASVRPVSGSILPDRTGQDSNAVTRTVLVSVGNADVLPVKDTDSITVTATDGTCPVGTVAGVNFAPRGAPPSNTASVIGGRRANGKLTLHLSAAGFATHNAKAPSRCAVQLTATGPSNPDPSPSNNATNVVIDVIDKNDF